MFDILAKLPFRNAMLIFSILPTVYKSTALIILKMLFLFDSVIPTVIPHEFFFEGSEDQDVAIFGRDIILPATLCQGHSSASLLQVEANKGCPFSYYLLKRPFADLDYSNTPAHSLKAFTSGLHFSTPSDWYLPPSSPTACSFPKDWR